jgi:hypothetical protein
LHDTQHAAPTANHVSATPIVRPVLGGMAGASIGLGFWSSLVFWWYPFGLIVATVGLVLGLIALARGARGPRGENFALIGVTLCGLSLSVTFTLNHVLRYLQWDQLW